MERMRDPTPPPGFEPLFRTSPFLDTIGPLFYRRDPDRGLVIGLRIAEKHANARGIAHGGLLVTLADIALGYRTAFGEDPPAGLITANLTADFPGAAGRRAARPPAGPGAMPPPLPAPRFGSRTSLPGVGPKLAALFARLLDREPA